MPEALQPGAMVTLRNGSRTGQAAVVSKVISEGRPGTVLILDEGSLVGLDVSLEDVDLAAEESHGFAQLAYQLIKLGSHVIEHRLIVHRR